MARILHICASSDFAQYVYRLLPALRVAGHEVHFVSAPGAEPERLFGGQGIEIHTVPIVRSMAPLSDVRALARLSSLMRRLKPDLVHAHTPKGGLLGMLAARRARIPARIYQMHGLRYETATGAKRSLLMGCDRIAAGAAHKVICVSPSVRDRAIRDGVVPRAKTFVLNNGSAQGLELENFDPEAWHVEADALKKSLNIPAQSACVLYMGRIAFDKGLSELAEAWSTVAARFPGAHLLLAGTIDPTDPIELAPFRALPQVHLLPHQEDPRPLLALADIVTLPSYREGLPQTILEAGAMEKPVVATRVTGVVDAVVDQKSGLLVPPRDAQALAQALIALIGDAERRRELGEGGRDFVGRRFPFEPIVRETLALYESVFAAKTSR